MQLKSSKLLNVYRYYIRNTNNYNNIMILVFSDNMLFKIMWIWKQFFLYYNLSTLLFNFVEYISHTWY